MTQPLDLTTLEFAILASLLKSKGRVKSRERLIEEVSDRRFDVFDRSIDVHVSSLRKKLGDDAKNPRFIRTIRGIGYSLQEPETPDSHHAMKTPSAFPLLAKVLGWLFLHLVILGLSFFLFVRWQLGLGLDSLLSGSAGERLRAFGDAVVAQIADLPPRRMERGDPAAGRGEECHGGGVRCRGNPGAFPQSGSRQMCWRASEPRCRRRATDPARPPDAPPGRSAGAPRAPSRTSGRRPPPPDSADAFDDPPAACRDDARRTPNGWQCRRVSAEEPAGLPRARRTTAMAIGRACCCILPPLGNRPRQPPLLLIRADRLDGSGMFFDFKPWLWGGIAVLLLSLAFWTPFVWGITRYLHRLTVAADRIAAGHFQVSLPPRGNDELGNLGRTIESMAARLDHLISGQKRFLGDAAHELCAPLARIRTGLGILEMKLGDADLAALASIEADTAELAALVEEILAFSRAGNRAPALRAILLEPLVREVLAREAADSDRRARHPARPDGGGRPGAVRPRARQSRPQRGRPRRPAGARSRSTPRRRRMPWSSPSPTTARACRPRNFAALFEPFYRLGPLAQPGHRRQRTRARHRPHRHRGLRRRSRAHPCPQRRIRASPSACPSSTRNAD